MTPHTPAADLFRELSDVQALIMDLLSAPGLHVTHWPSYYRLYLDVDELGGRVQAAACYLAERITGEDGLPDPRRIEAADGCLSGIGDCQRRIVDLLGAMERNVLISCDDRAIMHRLRCHFRPKSAWYLEFQKRYCAGKIAQEGTTLTRTIFLVDPTPTYRMPDLDEKQLVQNQLFDLSADDARAALARTFHGVSDRIAQVRARMGDYLVDHCTTKDLLHPSSM
ncbi:MAG TPA: hypothetical protein VJ654_17955 [Noviherbaspirillum sp.]|nr:hypothetical protein [Noviherbaspirillum sp.]